MNRHCLRIATITAGVWLALPALCHAEFRPMSLPELVQHSDVILVGRVVQVESIEPVSWDGTWKATRKTVIQVEQSLKGDAIPSTVEVIYGIGFICDVTEFEENTRYVLFLQKAAAKSHAYYRLTNFDAAQFRVADWKVSTVRWEWAGFKPVLLDRFLEKIRSLVSQGVAKEMELSRTAVEPDTDRLMAIAQNRALTLGYKPATSTIQILEPASPWWRSALRTDPNLAAKLTGKDVQLIQFLSKKQFGGGAVIILEKQNGAVLGEMVPRNGTGYEGDT